MSFSRLNTDEKIYALYASLRGNWSELVKERTAIIRKLLPHSSFDKKHLRNFRWKLSSIDELVDEIGYDNDELDLRGEVRDSSFPYYDLDKYMKNVKTKYNTYPLSEIKEYFKL